MNTNNIIFWNVDTQYDFMKPDGKLSVKNAERIEPSLEEVTTYAAKNNIKVVNTRDWHYKEDDEISDTPDFDETYPEHCMANTSGAKYVQATNPKDSIYIVDRDVDVLDQKEVALARNIIINKKKFNAYSGNSQTTSIVELLNPKAIITYGVATNVCVDYAVMGHRHKGMDVYVVENAIMHLPDELAKTPKDAVYKKWTENGVKFITSNQLDEIVGKYQ